MSKTKKVLLLIFLISGILLILNISLRRFLRDSSYFKIEMIDLDYLGSVRNSELRDNYYKNIFSQIRGKSIFSINLENMSKDLSKRYPEFKKIILNYQPPQKLNIRLQEYTPFAKLILDKQFLISEELVIFRGKEDLDLPEITGLQNKLKPKLYKEYKIPELLLSLELIKIYPHKIKKIDASKKETLTFFLDNGLKIKIGDKNYPQRLERLSLLLKELGEEIKDIEYIDLRFSDPVIKFK